MAEAFPSGAWDSFWTHGRSNAQRALSELLSCFEMQTFACCFRSWDPTCRAASPRAASPRESSEGATRYPAMLRTASVGRPTITGRQQLCAAHAPCLPLLPNQSLILRPGKHGLTAHIPTTRRRRRPCRRRRPQTRRAPARRAQTAPPTRRRWRPGRPHAAPPAARHTRPRRTPRTAASGVPTDERPARWRNSGAPTGGYRAAPRSPPRGQQRRTPLLPQSRPPPTRKRAPRRTRGGARRRGWQRTTRGTACRVWSSAAASAPLGAAE